MISDVPENSRIDPYREGMHSDNLDFAMCFAFGAGGFGRWMRWSRRISWLALGLISPSDSY